LSDDERIGLEMSPHLADALVLRRCDERAKDPAATVDDLDRWLPIVERVALRNA
jgi:predicted HD phosphohydrolase